MVRQGWFICRGNLTSRIVWTLLIEVLVFVMTIILAMVDSSDWPGLFFYLTIGSVIVLNSKTKLVRIEWYGCSRISHFSGLGNLPKHYLWPGSQTALQVHWSCSSWICKLHTYVMHVPFAIMSFSLLLQNLSGTIVSVISIISLALSPNPRTAAIYYFITALFILLACFDTYFALPLNVRLPGGLSVIPDMYQIIFFLSDFFDTTTICSTRLSMRRKGVVQSMLCPMDQYSNSASLSVSTCSLLTLWHWQSFQQC